MSLAAQTARSASNMNLALTLNWFIGVLEESHDSFTPSSALEFINEHLTELERGRLRLLEQDRIAREANDQLAEVLR